ncbi:hypothetical protein BT69DRAFT_1333378 [Atractiella rhizophila]|nr:hypothetical protein BT69DRAFT_1333378 [Atractiella rhizophila]
MHGVVKKVENDPKWARDYTNEILDFCIGWHDMDLKGDPDGATIYQWVIP